MLANIGEADGGIAPGTNFEDITDDWVTKKLTQIIFRIKLVFNF